MPSKPLKRGVNQVPQKLTSSIAFYKSLQLELAMDLINTPMPRVGCRTDENPEKKNFEKKNFLDFFFQNIFFKFFHTKKPQKRFESGTPKVKFLHSVF